MVALTAIIKKVALPARFDSDSYLIGVDTLSTQHMTNNLKDFDSPPRDTNLRLTGLSSKQVTKIGTVTWAITDDQGKLHIEQFEDVVYCETLPCRVLSPQCWDKQRKASGRGRARESTEFGQTILSWTDSNKQEYTKTIAHTSGSAVPIFRSAPGYRKYTSFIATNQDVTNDDQELFCCSAFKNEDGQPHLRETKSNTEQSMTSTQNKKEKNEQPLREEPVELDFGDQQSTEETIDAQLDESKSTAKAELLHWHYKLGHVPFSTIQAMASNKMLPARLARCEVPKCPGCMFGRATK